MDADQRVHIDPLVETLWEFVRGDMPVSAFEDWAYASPELEARLGEPLYMDVVSADYRDADQLHRLRLQLTEFAAGATPLSCRCLSLPNVAVVDMRSARAKDPVMGTLDEVKLRGKPWWWLSLERCGECRQWWLVAQEERINDAWVLERLGDASARAIVESADWPDDLSTYVEVLRIERDAGRYVRWADAINDGGAVRAAITDVLTEEPDVSLDELARLVSVSVPTARWWVERIREGLGG
jgi:hypothetical protein